MQCCPSQHWTSADTSTADHRFHFGPADVLFLELLVVFLHSFPVAHWTLSNLGLLIFRCQFFFFCHCVQFMGFSWQVYLSGLPFPPLVDHILSELSTMACLSLVALHGMAHSFIELHKPLCHKAVNHGRTPPTALHKSPN